MKNSFIIFLFLFLSNSLIAQTVVKVLSNQPQKFDITANSLYSISSNNIILGDSVSVTGGVTPYQYSWLKDGQLIGTSLQLVIPASNSTNSFTLNVKDANNCSLSKSTSITDINEINSDTSKILIYPNPTTSFLNINPKIIYGKLNVFVYDNKGNLMYNKQISGFTKLDINLSSGLYLIKILNKQNQFIVSKKFMVS